MPEIDRLEEKDLLFLDQLFFRLFCQKNGLGLKLGGEGPSILHFDSGWKNSVGVHSLWLRDYAV